MTRQWELVIAALTASLLLAACGGSGDETPSPPAPSSYLLGYTVTGLTGSGLALRSGEQTVSVAHDGQFNFPARLPAGSSYSVTVASQPVAPAQTCTVEQGAGVIANADVTTAAVRCVTTAAPRFAYAFNFGEDSISIYNVDAATGQLRTRGYVKTGPGGQQPVQSAAGKFSFVLNSGLDANPNTPLALSSISVFARDNVNGDLREIEGSPFVTSFSFVGASSLTLHPGGKSVYVTTLDNVIFQWSVAQDGTLTRINGDLVACGNSARRLVFDARGRFAYLTHVGHESDGVRIYEVDAVTGALSERAGLHTQFANRDLRTSNFAFHPAGRFAFVVNQDFAGGAGSLETFSVDQATGALTSVGQPLSLPAQATGVPIFDATGRFAYVLSFGTPARRGSVAGFSVNAATGAMTPLAGSPYEVDFAPRSLSLTPSGEFLYVANRATQGLTNDQGPGSIAAFRVDRGTGVLTRIPGIDSLQPAPFTASVDPSGRYLYAASLSGDRIHSYGIGAAGELQPISRGAVIRAGSQPVSIEAFVSPEVATPAAFTPRFVYMADTLGSAIASFGVDAVSSLLQATGSVSLAGSMPRALAPSADGRFLHVAELAGSATTLAIDAANGTLSAVAAGTQPAGASPASVAADPGNRFVYVGNFADGTVTPYRRDQTTGKLTAGTPSAIGAAPFSVVIDPTGRNLYAMSFARVRAYGIDPDSGKLSDIPDDEGGSRELVSTLGTQAAVDPSGRTLYVVSPQGMLEAYPIDSRTGALGEGSVLGIDVGSISLSIEPAGRFLYTAGSNSNTVSSFSVDQQTGALTEFARTPLVTEPRQVLADSSGRILWVLGFDNSIASFSIDAAGALTGIEHQPQQVARGTQLAALGVVR